MGRIVKQFKNNRAIIDVVVGLPNNNNGIIDIDRNKPMKDCKALIDTGSTISFISMKLVKELNLLPKGKMGFNNVFDKPKEINLYEIFLGIKIDEKIRLDFEGKFDVVNDAFLIPIRAGSMDSKAFENEEYEVLLGVPEIAEGHLTISGNAFIFSI